MQPRNLPFSRISVVGLGYIGLPTSAILASTGVEVVGVDIRQPAVDAINAGRIHFFEPGLEVLVKRVVDSRLLRAVTTPEPADAFVIAVPTPFSEGPEQLTPEPDLSFIHTATESIAPVLKPGDLIVLESTSPVGTTEKISQWLQAARPDLIFPKPGDTVAADIHIAYCPERVLPGRVLEELVTNDRIIGGLSDACSAAAMGLYHLFVEGDCIVTDARTAELTKLTENAYRDVNIAFANEMALICDRLDIDVWELIRLANRHPRVRILNPGPGVGGHCIAVDPWFIVSSAPQQAKLIAQARAVNDSRPPYVASQVEQAAGAIENPVIACLGLAFKPDIDDLRESPAMQVVKQLAHKHCGTLLAVEPNIVELPPALSALGVKLSNLDAALSRADIVVVLVDHKEFLDIDAKQISDKAVIDTRGLVSRLTNSADVFCHNVGIPDLIRDSV